MSEHDNTDSGFDQQFGPDPFTSWDEFFGTPPKNTEGYEFMQGVEVQDHNNTLPTVPFNDAGLVNGNIIPSQYSDLPNFASPSAYTFGPEPMSNMPLASADQTVDRPFHTTPPAQVIDAQPMSNTLLANPNAGGFSPIDFGLDVNNNNLGLINNTAPADQHIWPKPYPLSSPLSLQYPSSPPTPMPTILAPPGRYPVPVQKTEWPTLERKLFQQGDQAMAGAGAIEPSSPDDFSHLAAPPALRKLAPKPALDVGATTPMIHDVKAVPPPVVPVKKETKTQQPAPKTKPKKSTTSKARQTAIKEPIDNSELLVSSLDEAKTIAIKRIPLEVFDDDHDDVAAHPKVWVLKIARALDVEFRAQAEEDDRLTAEGRSEFTRWQKEHENKTWAILSDQKDIAAFAQSCAWILYDKALEIHQLGVEDVGKTIANGGADLKSKCSDRINAAITAMEEYSIVKYDFLRQDRLEALLANPYGFTLRKTENCWVNYKKKRTVGPVKTENEEKASRAAPKAKARGKRKREPSPPTSDDESEGYDVEMGENDEEFVQPTQAHQAPLNGCY
ncbi:hypothetical protein MBLNU13_g10220t1 [Cladosporium sp. NU13]